MENQTYKNTQIINESTLNICYYDASIGRFITEGLGHCTSFRCSACVLPIKDGSNWYIYCSNNPLNMVDPTGLDDKKLAGDKYSCSFIMPGFYVFQQGDTLFFPSKYKDQIDQVSLGSLGKYEISFYEDDDKFGDDTIIYLFTGPHRYYEDCSGNEYSTFLSRFNEVKQTINSMSEKARYWEMQNSAINAVGVPAAYFIGNFTDALSLNTTKGAGGVAAGAVVYLFSNIYGSQQADAEKKLQEAYLHYGKMTAELEHSFPLNNYLGERQWILDNLQEMYFNLDRTIN